MYVNKACSISFSEAAILLVSNGDHELWPVQHRKSAIHVLLVTLRMPRIKSDKSDWFWSQSIVFTKPFKTGMWLDLARGPDFQRMTKGTPGDEVEACLQVGRVALASGLSLAGRQKIARVYKQTFTGRVTLPPRTT